MGTIYTSACQETQGKKKNRGKKPKMRQINVNEPNMLVNKFLLSIFAFFVKTVKSMGGRCEGIAQKVVRAIEG